MLAAGFTSRELGIIAESALGTSLDGITQEAEPQRQAIALIQFAEKHEMVRDLRRVVLYTGADRPALQNLLLSEDMTIASGSDSSGNYIMLRVEAKLDQALAEQARQAALLSEVVRQQAQLDRRLYTVETSSPKPMQALDRMFLAILALLLVGMFAYNVLGVGITR